MNTRPHAQGIANILRTEIEDWRRAGNLSREAVAAGVIDAHQALGGEAATGVDFNFVGDAYAQAKKAAQKLFRWLDVDGTLPAGIVPSILQSLPVDVSLSILNKLLCPMGISARAADCAAPAAANFSMHLRCVMKESSEAQMALVNLPEDASDDQLLDAHRELIEASQACERAAQDAAARVAARQAPAGASTH